MHPNFDVYADDLFLMGDTFDKLMLVFEFVLKRMSEMGLKASKAKCQIDPTTFKILGYEFEKDPHTGRLRQRIPENRIDSARLWLRPTNKRALASRLSIVSYFSRNLLAIKTSLAYLYNFLRSSDNTWDLRIELEWCIFKTLLSLQLNLQTFDPDRGCILLTDASISGTG